jgi:6-phosphogluconolactonase (cycloisomerase 2 family)
MTSTLLWGTYKTNNTVSVATVKYDGCSSSASITETAVLPCGTGPTWIQQHPFDLAVVLVVHGSELRTYRCDRGSQLPTSRAAPPNWQQLSTSTPRGWRRIVHGSWSGDGSTIFAVDYDAAQVAVFAVKDFNITTEINRITFSGHGAYAPLQSSPHPHQVVQHPRKPWVYVSDLGTDQCVFRAMSS